MKTLMDKVLSRYGTSAVLQNAVGEQRIKVIFHSVNGHAWQDLERVFSPLGEVPRGKYVCILPADVMAEPEDTLTVCGRRYLLRRVEEMLLREDSVYRWALCVEKGSEDRWGMNS